MTRALEAQFAPFVTLELVDLILVSLQHINRFVRETSYYVCEKLIEVVHANPTTVSVPAAEFDARMSHQLGIGLSDNWSQVLLTTYAEDRRRRRRRR